MLPEYEPRLSSVPGYTIHHEDSGLRLRTLHWMWPTWFKPLGMPTDGYDPGLYWSVDLPDLVRAAGIQRRVSFLNRPSDWPVEDIPTPYDRLRSLMWERARLGKADWSYFHSAASGNRPALVPPASARLIQGWLYCYPGPEYWAQPATRVLLLLSPSAAVSLDRLLDRQAEAKLLRPGSGQVLQFNRGISGTQLETIWQVVHEVESPSDAYRSRHTARIVEAEDGKQPPFPTEAEANEQFVPWSKVIRRLTLVEQRRLLESAFGEDLCTA